MQIVYGGDASFNALVSGEQHPANAGFFQRQLESVSNNLTEVGRQLFANAKDIYEQFNGSEAMRIARDALRSVKSVFIQNRIQFLSEIESLQNAPFVMQRWVMANPVIRQAYHNQQCDGYSESYVDVFPKNIGENHYDYRRVMDGVVIETEDSWRVKFYPDEIHHGDKELDHDQKVLILNTWSIGEMFMSKLKEDPTSKSGGFL